MRYLKLSILLLLFPANLFTQSGWILQNSGTNVTLNDIFMINENTGYAAGNMGVILKTTNGGTNWNSVYNEYIYNIVALTFINSTTGWVFLRNDNNEVNNDSTFILKTQNGGSVWTKYFVDTNFTYWDWGQLQFLNSNTGYLADFYSLKKTTNGGLNWQIIHDHFSTRLFFVNELTGWSSGHGPGVYRTTNGGINWEHQQGAQIQNQNGADFYFFDSQRGFAIPKSFAINGPLYSTTNGGINWHYHIEMQDRYRSIQFVNTNIGYMLVNSYSAYNHKLAKTTNGGVNWVNHNIIYTARSLSKVFFSSVNTGWIVGDSGTILKTTSGGATIGIEPISTEIPNDYSLSQNYPNPFNPQTNIRFEIPEASLVVLKVYNSIGEEITTLAEEELRAGVYEVQFDDRNLPSGMYYYRITAGNYTQTKKMVLLK